MLCGMYKSIEQRFMRRRRHDGFEQVDLMNHMSRKTLRLVVGVRVH